jgi:putative transposase
MAGVATKLEGHALRVEGYYDHAHVLLRFPAKVAVADFVRQLKASTSKHINESNRLALTFHWQDEYLKMLADHEVEYDPKHLWE